MTFQRPGAAPCRAPSFELLLGLRVLTALPRPQCYRGVCGGWRTLPAVIESEARREDWIASDDTLANCDPSLPYVGCPLGGCGDSCCSDLNAHAEDASELITSYICHCANCQCMECLAQDENYALGQTTSAAGEEIFPMYLGLGAFHRLYTTRCVLARRACLSSCLRAARVPEMPRFRLRRAVDVHAIVAVLDA